MSDLFQVDGSEFVTLLNSKAVSNTENITLVDIFEAYVEVAHNNSNAVDKNLLRSLIFKQFQKYGDFDDKVRETAQAVSDITETTGEVIDAIQSDNKEHIENAYNKLKTYKSNMDAIEDSFFIDEGTSVYNRKYLFSKILNANLALKEGGKLFVLQIEDVDSISDDYGPIVLKSVTKKFAQSTKSALKSSEAELIRYDDNEFIIIASASNHSEIHNTLQLLHRTFEMKKFKLVGEKTLAFNFSIKEAMLNQGMLFEDVYKTVL